MSKALFVAEMELKPGVNGADVEKFWLEEYLPTVSELSGYQVTLHKGHLGARVDQFLFLGHFESKERAAQLWQDKIPTEEMQQWMAANPAFGKLMDFFDEKWFVEFTEYAELG
jgi:hypothetical protein